MKRNCLTVLALLLACLLVLTACDRGNQQGNNPNGPDNQQGSGTGTGQSGSNGGTGNQSGNGGTGNQSGNNGTGNESGGSGTQTETGKTTDLGTVDGVTYQLVTYSPAEDDPKAIRYRLCAVGGDALSTTVLYSTAGDLTYVAGSLEASGNTALYFTDSRQVGGPIDLYCYDLYSKVAYSILAAPCSNMVIFSGEGDQAGYGWILQEDYIIPVNLKTQMTDMSMAISIAELSVLAPLGSSFFADGRTAALKESDYGVLEITLTQGSTISGYLYTCDTFTAVKLK